MTSQPTVPRRLVRSLIAMLASAVLVGTGAVAASAASPTDAPPPTSSLSGTVTDSSTGTGIADASIVVIDSDGAEAASVSTGSTGGYTVSELAPGDYRISISAAPAYEPVFWPSAATLDEGQVVTLADGEARTGMDAALAVAAEHSLSAAGSATDSAESDNAAVSFTAEASRAAIAPATTAIADGATEGADALLTPAVTPGSPTVWGLGLMGGTVTAMPGTWAPDPVDLSYQWLADGAPITGATSSTFSLTAWQLLGAQLSVRVTGTRPGYTSATATSAAIAIRVLPSTGGDPIGSITGRVTSAATGAPIESVFVSATNTETEVSTSAVTDVDGRYAFLGALPTGPGLTHGLVPGNYVVHFDFGPDNGYAPYAPQYWDGVGTADEATPIVVTADGTVAHVDAALGAAASVSGTVGATGTFLVWALGDDDEVLGSVMVSNTGGSSPYPYRLYVPPGQNFIVHFTYVKDPGEQYWDHVATKQEATVLNLQPGVAQTGIDGDLSLADMTPAIPTITGSAVAGHVLTAVPGSWQPDGVAFTYQWSAAGSPIVGATGATFTPGDAEVGKTITVTVTGTKTGYNAVSRTSATVGPITAAPLLDLTVGSPSISGTPKVGEQLTAAAGTWGPSPVTLSYQWLVGGEPVTGATATTFTPGADAAGKTVQVTVLGSKAGYSPASATSPATGPVAPGDLVTAVPTISGTPQVGVPLTVAPGSWGPGSVTLSYQWSVGGAPVDGATGATFIPDASHVGIPVSVTVTGSEAGFTTASETSADTAAVAPGILTVSDPKVTGAVTVGQTLTVDVSDWGPAPVTLAYQWFADGTAIAGATSPTLALDASLVGAELSVTVTGTKPGFATAARTAVVGTVPPTVEVSNPSAKPGDEITVTGKYFAPGEEVLLSLHSDPISLGSVVADDDGSFTTTVTIPAAAEPGSHHIVVTGTESGLEASTPFTIAAAPAPVAPAPTAPTLPPTGSDLPLGILVLGMLLVAAGAVLTRRRRITN